MEEYDKEFWQGYFAAVANLWSLGWDDQSVELVRESGLTEIKLNDLEEFEQEALLKIKSKYSLELEIL